MTQLDFEKMKKAQVVLPLDDDKLYFVCYVVPGVFEIGEAYSSVVAFCDFLGFNHSEGFEPVLDDLRVLFNLGLNDLFLFSLFVSNSYDMNRNFKVVVQKSSEIDKSSAKFISSCFILRCGKGLL